jgi:hypothetical protein
MPLKQRHHRLSARHVLVKELARLPSVNRGLCARLDTLNCNPQVLKVLQAEVERRRS